jgi:hypothetical protein
MGAFSGLSERIKSMFQGIADAIRGGNIELVWKIVCKGMELSWAVMLDNMRDDTQQFIESLGPLLNVMAASWGMSGDEIRNRLRVAGNTRDMKLAGLRGEYALLMEQARQAANGMGSDRAKKLGYGLGDFSGGSFTRGIFGGMMAGQALGGGGPGEKMVARLDKANQHLASIDRKAKPLVFG